jgi:hypothetical protein
MVQSPHGPPTGYMYATNVSPQSSQSPQGHQMSSPSQQVSINQVVPSQGSQISMQHVQGSPNAHFGQPHSMAVHSQAGVNLLPLFLTLG